MNLFKSFLNLLLDEQPAPLRVCFVCNNVNIECTYIGPDRRQLLNDPNLELAKQLKEKYNISGECLLLQCINCGHARLEPIKSN